MGMQCMGAVQVLLYLVVPQARSTHATMCQFAASDRHLLPLALLQV